MRKLVAAGLISLGLILAAGPQAAAEQNPVHWTFTDLEVLDGQSASFATSTAIEPTCPLYDFDYSITKVEVWLWLGWLDITDEVPLEDRTGSGTQAGPCPIEIMNEHVEGSGAGVTASADVHAYVDASGFGHVEITNPDLGGLSKARISAVIDVEGASPEPMADFNDDGVIDDLDLTILATHWQMAGGHSEGDADCSGFVDDVDLTALATKWPSGDLNASAVPEPATLSLLALGGLALLRRKRRYTSAWSLRHAAPVVR